MIEKRLFQQGYTFELDPNQAQRVQLAKSVGCSRYVYNWGLAASEKAYQLTGKRPKHSDLKKQLVELKKGDCPWLYEVSAHISQQALVDLERAFDRFFKGLKGTGPKAGFPKFKRKGVRDSARFYEVTLEERHLRLPNVGRLRLKESCSERGFQGRVVSATVRRRVDRWFVSLCVQQERVLPHQRLVRRSSDVVGVDLGLKTAAVIHDGAATRVIEPQRVLRKNLKKLRRLNRQLARREKGSANREKARLELARLALQDCLPAAKSPPPAIESPGENQVSDRGGGLARQRNAEEQASRALDQRCGDGRVPSPARLQERVVRVDTRCR